MKSHIKSFSILCGLAMAALFQSQAADINHPPGPPPIAQAIEISDGPAYNFGVRPIKSNTTHTFSVTNTGTSLVTLLGGHPLPPPFSYVGGTFPGTGGTCGSALNPSESCTVVVQFSPRFPGRFIAAFEILYSVGNLAGHPHPLPMIAHRIMKGASVPYGPLTISDSPSYDFGNVAINTTASHTFTLTNTGPAPIKKISPTFYTNNGSAFSFAGGSYPGTGGTCGEVIMPNSSCTIVVEFSPTQATTYSATLSILYKTHGGYLYVTEELLTGTGMNIPLTLGEGGYWTCAQFADGQIKCWGYNGWGALGLGDTVNRGDAPGQMGANLPFVDLGTGRTVQIIFSSGGRNSCAILDNNELKCWGANEYGQLGLGDTMNRGPAPGQMGDNLPAIDLGTGLYAIKVVNGQGAMCALLNNNKIKCWGQNSLGQLGLGDTNNRGDQPGEMGDNLPFVDLGDDTDGLPYEALDIVAGQYSFCALLRSGNVKCWGANAYGQLGIGNTINQADDPARPLSAIRPLISEPV